MLGLDSERKSSSPRELRIGIVGAGKMATHHARAVQRPAVSGRLVAVADPDDQLRAKFATTFSAVASFDSLESMISSESVDVLHVCTPPATHEKIAVEALESGHHIYIEKPFAESPESAERILAIAAEKGLRVCAGHQLLFEPPARRALELLSSIGSIHHIESYFAFRPVRHGAAGSVPVRADHQLLDVLPHPVYSLIHFLEVASPKGRTQILNCEIGPGGTVHAHVQRGDLTASLVVTLHGRPVESFLHLSGTNGSIHADFVRSTVQHLIGPGSSAIEKIANPYRLAIQLILGTTGALANRFLRRQKSYPGLAEIFDAFYCSIREGARPPVSESNIVETVRMGKTVADVIQSAAGLGPADAPIRPPRIAVTGGTGFLGSKLVEFLVSQGEGVRVLARREPAPWDRVHGVDYVVTDLGAEIPASVLDGIETVLHLAAETAGGFEEHQRNSVQATENIARCAASVGVVRFIHVSSLAVFQSGNSETPIREDTPIESHPRERGPYVWGKVESEAAVLEIGRELNIAVTIARPGAIVDYDEFDPPGRLGRRLGNLFVAVGSPSDRLGIVQREMAAEVLAWMSTSSSGAPDSVNLLQPVLPTKRELVNRLKDQNPGLRVVWLPSLVLRGLSWLAVAAQCALLRRAEPVNVAKIFAVDEYETALMAELVDAMGNESIAAERPASGDENRLHA